MGLGQALFEEMIWDERGTLQNPTCPTTRSLVPRRAARSSTRRSSRRPAPSTSTASARRPCRRSMPAVANAVSRALGVRVDELPITPEKVLRLLASAGGRGRSRRRGARRALAVELIELTVNGLEREVAVRPGRDPARGAPPRVPDLRRARVLRDRDVRRPAPCWSMAGRCSSCLVLAGLAGGLAVETVEGLGTTGALHPSSRRSSTTAASSARTARPASSWPPRRFSPRTPTHGRRGPPRARRQPLSVRQLQPNHGLRAGCRRAAPGQARGRRRWRRARLGRCGGGAAVSAGLAIHRPRTLDAAIELLGRYGEDARIVAGSTAVTIMVRQRLIAPAALVSHHRDRRPQTASAASMPISRSAR